MPLRIEVWRVCKRCEGRGQYPNPRVPKQLLRCESCAVVNFGSNPHPGYIPALVSLQEALREDKADG